MKQKLLVLFLLLKSAVMIAQTNVYQPFPKDSALWTYRTAGYNGTSGYERYSWEQWLGDTIINSRVYTKIYSVNGNSTTYTGAVRQDIPNEKIYKMDLNGVEKDVSVNQHLGINDTFLHATTSNPTLIIKSIDSVSVGTKQHKRYNGHL